MTKSVTPDAPLVDPETGETPPLSPQERALIVELAEWAADHPFPERRFTDLLKVRPMEPDDAA